MDHDAQVRTIGQLLELERKAASQRKDLAHTRQSAYPQSAPGRPQEPVHQEVERAYPDPMDKSSMWSALKAAFVFLVWRRNRAWGCPWNHRVA